MTITEFLLARIAEDESVANAAHRESMRGNAGPGFVRSRVAWAAQAKDVRGHELIERITPARVLAECEAKRRIVDHFTSSAPGGDGEAETYWFEGFRSAMEFVLWKMAQPYADHPDYREEWTP